MEIYDIYSYVTNIIGLVKALSKNALNGFSMRDILITSAIASVVVWLGLFILQGFALLAMAKKQKIKNKWLAFVPFANIMFMGKIAGECSFFGRKMKSAGLYVMLAQMAATLVSFAVIAAELYLYIACGDPTYVETQSMFSVSYIEQWNGLSGFSYGVSVFYSYGSLIMSIFGLVYQILMLVLMIAILKKYTPRSFVLLSFLSLFVPLSRYIILFVLRNRQPIDYEEYMRKRREEYMRRQQEYYSRYGNPYNNPYGGNPYNNPYGNRPPYGGNPYNNPAQGNPQPQAKDEDPFEEFSSAKSGQSSSAGKADPNDPDTFFN